MPYLNFTALDDAMAHLKRAARAYDAALADASARAAPLSLAQCGELDARLQGLEQALTSDDGLPGRAWCRRLIYASSLFTGYGAKTLPGVTELHNAPYHTSEEAYVFNGDHDHAPLGVQRGCLS